MLTEQEDSLYAARYLRIILPGGMLLAGELLNRAVLGR
jgi:hypothetical protein